MAWSHTEACEIGESIPAAPMSSTPESTVHAVFAALDNLNLTEIMSNFDDDITLVDELSRRWIFGKSDVEQQLRSVLENASDIQSVLSDVRMLSIAPEAILVTCWLEQTYTFAGIGQSIEAPTSATLRRQADGWKIVSFHTIPLSPG